MHCAMLIFTHHIFHEKWTILYFRHYHFPNWTGMQRFPKHRWGLIKPSPIASQNYIVQYINNTKIDGEDTNSTTDPSKEFVNIMGNPKWPNTQATKPSLAGIHNFLMTSMRLTPVRKECFSGNTRQQCYEILIPSSLIGQEPTPPSLNELLQNKL